MVHLVHDTNGGRQSYQASWMSRWMRTSCNMRVKSLGYSSNADVNDFNCITQDTRVTLRSAEGLGMIETTVTSDVVDGSKRPSTGRFRNERSCDYLFKDGQENDEKGASAHESGRKFECGKGIYLKNGFHFWPVLHGIPAANDTSIRGCHFLDAVTTKNNLMDLANLRILQHKGREILSLLTDFDPGKKKDRQSLSNISLNDSFRERNTSLLFYTPSVCDHHFPKVPEILGDGPSPSQYIASAKTGSEKSCFECISLHKLPHCIHDAEIMKINTTSGSVEGRFSQRSNILLVTVNSDASMLKECDILITRRLVTKINRNIPSDLHRLSLSGQGKQGVILEPLTCSADSEGSGNTGDINTSKVTLNKVSSAETHTMDMNFSKERTPLLGGHSSSSNKAFHMEANSDSSSSKAPGLEVEIPMECANQTKQKSNLCLDNSAKAEAGYRWVKRLKLSSSHSSARGTEGINLAESSSRKRNNCFGRTLKSDLTRLESTLRIRHGEESMAMDDSINLSKKILGNDSSLSHIWIQRWLHDGSKSTRKKPHTIVDCEPQSLKWALEDLQKDRSPSIRALMGKAMESFQPYQLEKRGSLTIWNT